MVLCEPEGSQMEFLHIRAVMPWREASWDADGQDVTSYAADFVLISF